MSSEIAVVALSVDLMDRSKLSAGLPGVRLVRNVAAAVDAATEGREAGATVVVIADLARVVDGAELATIAVVADRVIAYGSHVDEQALEAATANGAEALPRSRFFRRLAENALI
ncbi:MAG: hypothetical protein AAF567_10235 [Actinomycetota bacterium]